MKIIAVFNKKIGLFVKGRKNVFQKLESHLKPNDRVIWFHCASLGEFEQGRPIIENCREKFKDHKILVTFFSPSGYEIRKDYAVANLVTYLPLDTKRSAINFLEIVNPDIAIFIKYEFWPNLLKQLSKRKIKTVLVSGIFRKEQPFFKWYGGWMRNSLKTFSHFFVQNNKSKQLLEEIGYRNVTVSGDTRFDRVYDITQQNNTIELVQKFKDEKTTLVVGSTWPKDEELLEKYINIQAKSDQKFIIAPHNINPEGIAKLKKSIKKEVLAYTEIKDNNLSTFQVLIIDTIGMLSKIYAYADIAYVGGGFGAGIHNILEPATFGVPLLIGPNYHKFNEAKELVNLDACSVIHNYTEMSSELTTLFNAEDERTHKGRIAKDYIHNNIGATDKIINYLLESNL